MRLLPRGLLVAALFAGCVYKTDRTQGITDGEIRGTAKRDDGSAAVHARVELAGSARVVHVGTDGTFAVKDVVPGTWILHVVEDEAGHGAPERAAWAEVTTRFVPVPKNLTDGCTGAPPSAVTTQLLGDVVLQATRHVKGTVSVPVGEQGRVVVWRDVGTHAAPIEGAAGVAVDGSFDVGGVAPGKVHVAVFTFDPLVDPAAVAPLHVSTADADVDADAGAAGVTVTADQSAARTFSVQVDAQWNTPKTAAVTVTSVLFTPPDEDGANPLGSDDNGGGGFPLDDKNRSFVVTAPAGGVLDLQVQSDTVGAVPGTLRGAVVVDGVLPLGPVELPVLVDPCGDVGGQPDCDHDGVPGLPVPSDDPADPTRADYGDCAAACADHFGGDVDGVLCDAHAVECDDDGDGQPDVTEPPNCIGPGKGTDLDGDGLCEPNEDPFPLCASNDPADPACAAPTFSKPAARYP